MHFSFGDEARQTFERAIGSFPSSFVISFADELRQIGVDVQAFEDGLDLSEEIACRPGEGFDAAVCLATAVSTGVFGSLIDNVRLSGGDFYIPLRGDLVYYWQDRTGTHQKSSPFDTSIRLARLHGFGECGEGGDFPDHRFPIALRLDQQDYRIGVTLDDELAAGTSSRWGFQVGAEMSSHHTFRLVLQLSDGQEVASPFVDLLFFWPKQLEDLRYGG